MKQIYYIVLSMLLFGCSIKTVQNVETGNKIDAFQKLSDEFILPPNSSRPGAFWCWLNGDVTNSSITYDLQEMKNKGMGRAEIWDVAAINNPNGAYGKGPQFLGDKSVESIKHALSEGKRLGIKMGMVASSGWNAGGSWVTPAWAAKELYFSEFKINGSQSFSGALPFPAVAKECPKDKDGIPVFFKEIAVLAIRDRPDKTIKALTDIVILNNKFDGKVLKWEVPQGNWILLRVICSNTGQHLVVPSPNSDGLFIDFFDPKATIKHLSYILGRLGITKENARQSGLDYLEFDSMELSDGTPWTDSMDSVFYAHNKYNILPYLPAFAGWKLPDGNEHFLYQFKKTVSDLLIFSHYTTGRDFLAGYGMELVAEAGGPGPPIWNSCPVESLKALGNASIPRGEFWVRNRYNIFLVKEIASASHIYGQGIVDAESFTTWRRWKDAPHDLKKEVDRAFCEGLNSVTIHAFANTRPEHGLPGRSYHAGIDINPTATWWGQSKPFMDYLSRCSFMLMQGKFAADVAWYYGDKSPNFFPEIQGATDSPRPEGLSAGYDFDIINSDVLLNRMEVSKGKLMLPDGLNYKLLVIPNRKDIPIDIVKKVEKLIANGANVLIQHPAIAKLITGNAFKNISIDEALARLSVAKDFTADPAKLDFIHRTSGKTEIYFVRNKTGQAIAETCEFRIENGKPEFWDPVSVKQYILSAVKGNGKTSTKLQLPPYGSCFVVFNAAESRQLANFNSSRDSKIAEVKGPWTLFFPEKWGAPASVELNDLISWTDHTNEGIKYFSGTASYKNSFYIPKLSQDRKKRISLDLGEVLDVAEVFVNGKSAGIVWTKPFRIDIQDLVKQGKNDLEISITNMWINRLTGDMHLPADKRFCKTNQPFITKDRSQIDDDYKKSFLMIQPSGLIGPVYLTE